ncbi:Uncharacterised protein [Klebsiella michiganensis]|uniref:Uncharacterized protein n=1 Tax=Klebsiella michiganensis TaxID=1134687 RepID=A0A7H4PHM3_9ENTR|nr:Uncharacterised protein [Klebsiella michiganensis]
MRIDAAGGDDLAFRRNNFRGRADRDRDVGLNIRVAGFADREDPPVFDADIGFDDPPVIDDQGICQHQIHTPGGKHLSLAHTVADHFATAEFDLFAVGGQIIFDLDPQLGVRQANFIAGGGAEHVGIGLT